MKMKRKSRRRLRPRKKILVQETSSNFLTCANVLNLINLNPGAPAMRPCCSILLSLVDLDTALCLSSVLMLSILDITINIPIHLNLALNACGGTLPDGFCCLT
ncbi:hypothetical protein N665_0584s0021 [Sinapis alba]|nr:hypothetical protein N665_0584s0021 [Sinapis alba]